jgi:hypothetical protein
MAGRDISERESGHPSRDQCAAASALAGLVGAGQEIIASGILASAHALGELQERRWSPRGDPGARHDHLPAGQSAGQIQPPSAAALPYLLEEQIASDVDDLHLVVLGHQGREVDLMAVDKGKMQSWLSLAGAGRAQDPAPAARRWRCRSPLMAGQPCNWGGVAGPPGPPVRA